ncbi:hypothetical protein B0J17DRAFT_660634 [Rhizoctonia solani]|nr:hypothetical protein B0J17DRAFT_660634 [Rhizoctonia solani]
MLFLNRAPGAVKEAFTPLPGSSGSAVFVGKASNAKYDAEPIIRHSEFFFDNTLIAIQIENTLFNVHKYQLAKSGVFSGMFKLPKHEGDELEASSSPEHPIVTHGATASDFAAMLKALYASHFSGHQPAPEASLIIPAFRLANLLGFSNLRAYLLPLAEQNLDDVDKIVFAREFDIKEWLTPAHVRLCKREEHLSIEEARKLKVDSVLMISLLREQHRGRGITATTGGAYCSKCIGVAYYGCGTYTCKDCFTAINDHYVQFVGPSTMGAKANNNDASLEAEVKKWVEDGCAMRMK